MWRPDKSKLITVRLQSQGEDVETPWAEDLGPDASSPGARLARLGNVPFLHAKPTYGDVISVVPDANDGALTWDDNGVPWDRIAERLREDCGRWALIVEYVLDPPADDAKAAFAALDRAGEKADIVIEGCFGPRDGRPGRAYLAAPLELDVAGVMEHLAAQQRPLKLTVVHPVDGDESG